MVLLGYLFLLHALLMILSLSYRNSAIRMYQKWTEDGLGDFYRWIKELFKFSNI